MKKVLVGKIAICTTVVAALCVVAATNSKDVKTATLNAETSVAGVELLLDNYYSVSLQDRYEEYVTGFNSEINVDNQISTASIDGEDDPSAKIVEPVQTEVPDVTKAPEETKTPAETPEPVSELADIGVSVANPYVNVREKADTESEIQGKLYKGCAATILETKGDWVKIKSGNVKGYIKSEFLAIGFDAEELVDKYATKWATVTTETLYVREKKTTESKIITMIPLGESYEVLKEYKEWAEIRIDEDTTGFVSKDYLDIEIEFEHAISVEEERIQKEKEEAAKKAEAEQLEKLRQQEEEKKNQQSNANTNNNTSSSKNYSSSKNNNSSNSNSNNVPKDNGGSTTSGSGASIAAYAQRFVGYPYVYGGTSLTNGADCSGFTQTVYKHFGVSIGRSSRDQVNNGRKVSMSELKAGDLLFYTRNGRINHVAMYIGGGQVVHASTPKTGIKISQYNYRTPYTARRIVE